MVERRLFPEGTIPEQATPGWYQGRERAPHLEQSIHWRRLDTAVSFVRQLARPDSSLGAVVDLGAGDGGLLQLLLARDPELEAWGYDLCPANLAGAAERGVRVELVDVTNPAVWGGAGPGYVRRAPIVVMTEFLEHLLDPHWMVRRVASFASVVVASSPQLEDPRTHMPEHLWTWDRDGYRRLLETGGYLRVVRHVEVDLFQVVLAVRDPAVKM